MKYTGFVLIMSLGILFFPSYIVQAVTAAPTQTTTVKVIIHLLDANNQPLAGVTINLVLNRYGDTIEEIQAGSCVTDATGSCSITVDDPPRLRSGKIEGFIDLGEYGRQLIGWKGDSFEITLQLYPDGKLATLPAPLDAPYEGQTSSPRMLHYQPPQVHLRQQLHPALRRQHCSILLPLSLPLQPWLLWQRPHSLSNPLFPPFPLHLHLSHPTQSHEKSGWAWIGWVWCCSPGWVQPSPSTTTASTSPGSQTEEDITYG